MSKKFDLSYNFTKKICFNSIILLKKGKEWWKLCT